MSDDDDAVESMEVDNDEAPVTLSVMWSEGVQPQKCKVELQRALQSWANRSKICADITLDVLEDGRAVVRIKPTQDAHAVSQSVLYGLLGQTLPRKDEKTVTIVSVSVTPLELVRQLRPEDSSVSLLPSSVSEPQDEQVQLVQPSSFSGSAAVSTEGKEADACFVPVDTFWYVHHIHKEEIKRIEKENGVKIQADVKVTFEGDQKDGGPEKALSEFTSLVQKILGELAGSNVPLKHVDPEELKDTLKVIRRKENKLLLTLFSEEITVYGPRQIQNAVSKSLKGTTNANTFIAESTWASQDKAQSISKSLKDPLADAGLTLEESFWRLMTASFDDQLAKIKAKFGVDLKESRISQGKVRVKARYKRSGGNVAMESHAVRALLHLYQKISTSDMNFTQHHGATGFNGSDHQSEGASSGPALNGAGGGATAADHKDENCPICMDVITNKKQLKCKHEFCERCLAQSKESLGPICPVCRDVFGVMEGNQPKGKMTWQKYLSSLPGFPNCGNITINYEIPSGLQTEKHPHPGRPYSGVRRTAFLPDNNEGNQVLHLLKKAFDQKLIFTVGTSRTTGMEDQVTWNDIHHKTVVYGGSFGYPDAGYLSRVRKELQAKGIK